MSSSVLKDILLLIHAAALRKQHYSLRFTSIRTGRLLLAEAVIVCVCVFFFKEWQGSQHSATFNGQGSWQVAAFMVYLTSAPLKKPSSDYGAGTDGWHHLCHFGGDFNGGRVSRVITRGSERMINAFHIQDVVHLCSSHCSMRKMCQRWKKIMLSL